MKLNTKSLTAFAMMVVFSLFIGCSGGGGSGGGSIGSGGGTGTLSLWLTDATDLDYDAVYVTIDRVEVHLVDNGNGPNKWETVATPRKTYNLLELINGVRERLGLAELASGYYTQMRLIIGSIQDDSLNIFSTPHPHANYVILKGSGQIHELKVPSGPQTGIKLVHGFTIEPEQTAELILDFDASRSVVKAGASGLWLLKPTIKVIDTKDYAIISGTVVDDQGNPIPGVLVSAQIYYESDDPDVEPVDRKDQVLVWTSTVTGENGEYKLFLEPGTYNIVAYLTGYFPDVVCFVALDHGDVVPLYSSLGSADIGTISGVLVITGDQHATISFRQFLYCGSTLVEFEVKAINTKSGYFTETLSEGDYDVVASSYEKDTIAFENVTVVEGEETPLGYINM